MSLMMLCIFFFVLSWFYAHGLKTIFRHNFKWHYASVVGIALVITTTAWFDWQYQKPLTFEYAWSSLVLVFICALPGMVWHGEQYLRDRRAILKELRTTKSQLIELDIKNMMLDRERNHLLHERELLKYKILPILERVEKNQNNEAQNLAELTGIINMYLWAKQEVENRN